MATESFGACKHKDIQLVHIFDCLADASLHTRLSTRSHNLILMGGLWDSYTCPKISDNQPAAWLTCQVANALPAQPDASQTAWPQRTDA